MSSAQDWRDPDYAPVPEGLGLPGYAFEFLRRNPTYQQAYQHLKSQRLPVGHDAMLGFARQWGLRFRD